MKFQFAAMISIALPRNVVCDEVALLQTATVVKSRSSRLASSAHVDRNLTGHVANPGTPCPTNNGWQIATLPPDSIGAGSYCLPPSDGYGMCQSALLAGTVYEEGTHNALETYMTDAPAGDIIHGGSFIGDFLPHLSRLAKAGSRVYAFEPDALYMQATVGTVAESHLTNIHTVEAGMSNESALFELVTHHSTDNGSAFFLCIPIDEVVEADRPVSLLSLDVEGYELLALQGAAKTLERYHPIVVAAVLDQKGQDGEDGWDEDIPLASEDDVAAYLSTFGYVKFDEHDDNVFFRVQ